MITKINLRAALKHPEDLTLIPFNEDEYFIVDALDGSIKTFTGGVDDLNISPETKQKAILAVNQGKYNYYIAPKNISKAELNNNPYTRDYIWSPPTSKTEKKVLERAYRLLGCDIGDRQMAITIPCEELEISKVILMIIENDDGKYFAKKSNDIRIKTKNDEIVAFQDQKEFTNEDDVTRVEKMMKKYDFRGVNDYIG